MRGNELLNKMELIDPVYVNAADAKPRTQKHGWLQYGLIAACLCIICLVAFWGIPNSANVFSVKAYAIETADDGAIKLTETDLMEQSEVWGGYCDGENFYVSVGFRYDGENIESVDFTTKEGFFAKQYIDNLAMEENIPKMYVGADNKLVMYGTDFEIVGNLVTLNDQIMTDDLLLFWGTKEAEMSEPLEHIDITATATFYDGRTQEVLIPIDLSGTGVTAYAATEERIQEAEEQLAIYDYYMSLPLEKCELLEDSVKTVVDAYEVNIGGGTDWVTVEDAMALGEDGIYKAGIRGDHTGDDYDVYIPVLKRDANGVYTGMIYRVPENLQYENLQHQPSVAE